MSKTWRVAAVVLAAALPVFGLLSHPGGILGRTHVRETAGAEKAEGMGWLGSRRRKKYDLRAERQEALMKLTRAEVQVLREEVAEVRTALRMASALFNAVSSDRPPGDMEPDEAEVAAPQLRAVSGYLDAAPAPPEGRAYSFRAAR